MSANMKKRSRSPAKTVPTHSKRIRVSETMSTHSKRVSRELILHGLDIAMRLGFFYQCEVMALMKVSTSFEDTIRMQVQSWHMISNPYEEYKLNINHVRPLQKFQGLLYLDLHGNKEIDGTALFCLRTLPKLLELDLQDCIGIRDEGLAHIAYFPSLKRLNLSSNGEDDTLTGTGLSYLSSAKLEYLSLCNRLFTDEDIVQLLPLGSNLETELCSLNLNDCGELTCEGLSRLCHCTSLIELRVSGCQLYGSDFPTLLPPSLRVLDVSYCKEVTDPGEYGVMHIPKSLRTLELAGPDVMDSTLEMLELPKLNRLIIRESDEITNSGLAHLPGRFPELQELSFIYCDSITDAGLVHVAKMDSLRSLSIQEHLYGEFHITNVGMSHIENLGLHNLRLNHCGITDAGLDSISRLPLHTLNLTGCGITKNGLPRISKMPLLRTLSLRSNHKLTGSLDLESLSFLHTLDLVDCEVENIYFQDHGMKIDSGRMPYFKPTIAERLSYGYVN